MKLHANARTCPHSRRLVVERVERQGWTLAAAAEAAGMSVRTVSKWLGRSREEGGGGLLDGCAARAWLRLGTEEARVAGIGALPLLENAGRGIRRAAGDAALDCLGDL